MELVIIILLVISILLFILSIFKNDRSADLEKNIEDLTMQHIQDVYQLKKKLRILEEELLIQDSGEYLPHEAIKKPIKVNEILKSQVLALYDQDFSIDEISKRSTLTHEEIMKILQSSQMRGLK